MTNDHVPHNQPTSIFGLIKVKINGLLWKDAFVEHPPPNAHLLSENLVHTWKDISMMKGTVMLMPCQVAYKFLTRFLIVCKILSFYTKLRTSTMKRTSHQLLFLFLCPLKKRRRKFKNRKEKKRTEKFFTLFCRQIGKKEKLSLRFISQKITFGFIDNKTHCVDLKFFFPWKVKLGENIFKISLRFSWLMCRSTISIKMFFHGNFPSFPF